MFLVHLQNRIVWQGQIRPFIKGNLIRIATLIKYGIIFIGALHS